MRGPQRGDRLYRIALFLAVVSAPAPPAAVAQDTSADTGSAVEVQAAAEPAASPAASDATQQTAPAVSIAPADVAEAALAAQSTPGASDPEPSPASPPTEVSGGQSTPPPRPPASSAAPAAPVATDGGEPADASYDPYRYGVRVGVFPVHVLGAWSQGIEFGSSLRAEIDIMPRVAVAAWGRAAWPWQPFAAEGDDAPPDVLSLGGGVGLRYFFMDKLVRRSASGTVYPQDVGIARDADAIGTATGADANVPVNQKLGGPQMLPAEVDYQAIVPMRGVHALRLGYDFVRGAQQGRDDRQPRSDRVFDNRVHMLHLGWGWGSHWNLSPKATGARELGFRRIYIDLLASMPVLATAQALDTPEAGEVEDVEDPLEAAPDNFEATFLPVGLRAGLSGATNAMLDSWEGLGLAYQLEVGALPGYSGIEWYVHVGLGVELDFAGGAAAPSDLGAAAVSGR